MPLAGYPSETLFPAGDLYPGIPGFRAIFETPTRDMAHRLEGNLFSMLPHAISVWQLDGVWHEGFDPGPTVVDAADRFYRGGYQHDVDETEVEELTEAGYGSRITILET
jgi:hypothetical protein